MILIYIITTISVVVIFPIILFIISDDPQNPRNSRNRKYFCYYFIAAMIAALVFVEITVENSENQVRAKRSALAVAQGTAKNAYHLNDYESLKSMAEVGVPSAQYFLGTGYIKGKVAPKDAVEGIKWLQWAANQGNPEAQSDLGILYALGACRRNSTGNYFMLISPHYGKDVQIL